MLLYMILKLVFLTDKINLKQKDKDEYDKKLQCNFIVLNFYKIIYLYINSNPK